MQYLFIGFGLSFLISKSLFTIFYVLVLVGGLIAFKWNNFRNISFLQKCLISLYPVGVCVSFFSLAGAEGAFEVLARWSWPLIYFPADYLFERPSLQKKFYGALAISLTIACLFSLVVFYLESEFEYDAQIRINSFWDVLRWSYFCAVASCVLFALLLRKGLKDKKVFACTGGLFLLCNLSLLLTNSRAPWIATIIGLTACLIVQRKPLRHYLLLGIAFLGIALSSTSFRDRLLTTFKVKAVGSQITSENISNAGRLHMWKVTFDLFKEIPFFGTGFGHSSRPLKDHIARSGQKYAQAYTLVEYSFIDQHSSYLSVLLQFGGLYFIYIYAFLLITLWKLRRDDVIFPPLLATFIIYIFYSGIMSFEASVLFGLTSLGILRHEGINPPT